MEQEQKNHTKIVKKKRSKKILDKTRIIINKAIIIIKFNEFKLFSIQINEHSPYSVYFTHCGLGWLYNPSMVSLYFLRIKNLFNFRVGPTDN